MDTAKGEIFVVCLGQEGGLTGVCPDALCYGNEGIQCISRS